MAGRIANVLSKAGLVCLAGGVVGSMSLYTIEAGHRGLIVDRARGLLPEPVSEGSHFLIPVLQRYESVDVRTTPRKISTLTGTKYLQNVNLSLRVLYRPQIPKLASLFDELGHNYADRILPSVANEVLKAVVANYDAKELLIKRETISKQIRDQMAARCKNFHVILDDVSLTDLTFSTDFARAIEDKQVAEQRAERAKFIVERTKQMKRVAVIGAEADAEAASLLSDAIKSHGRGMIEVRRIETGVAVAETLAKSRGNVTYVPSTGQNMLLNIDGVGGRSRR